MKEDSELELLDLEDEDEGKREDDDIEERWSHLLRDDFWPIHFSLRRKFIKIKEYSQDIKIMMNIHWCKRTMAELEFIRIYLKEDVELV